jgi:gamma-glutamylcyclotransferase (GGCT)/AIG2-like uncharacterized protein YtfP
VPSHLFVYGTLRPGCAPDEIAHVAAKLRLVGEASVAGELYDLGHYPGAVLSDAPGCRISGLLFELPGDVSVLRALDEYEEFVPESPAISQFVRVQCEARRPAGNTVPCWIYVYARPLTGARRIADGVWRGSAR